MESDKQDYYYVVKFIIVGDTGVGKSTLTDCFSNNKNLDYNNRTSTIGVEFFVKTCQVDGKFFRLQMWDTAGQEKYRAITRSYYRGADASLVCFSICNRHSFNSVTEFIDDMYNFGSPDLNAIMVGTFGDKDSERQVDYDEACKFSEENGLEYIETSSKTGKNVEEAFYKLVKKISQKIDRNEITLKKHINKEVSDFAQKQDSNCCK